MKILAIAKLHHAFANHYLPLASCDHVDNILAYRPEKWRKGNLRGIDLRDFEKHPLFIALFFILVAATKNALKGKCDLVVAFTPIPYGLIAYIVSRLTGIPFHMGIIDETFESQFHGIRGKINQEILMKAKTVSVSGKKTKEALSRLSIASEKVYVLPHGVSDEFYPETLSRKEYDGIFVGDLLPVKRVESILLAWAELLKMSPGKRLCIVGDGPERQALERSSKRLGIAGNVEFVGYQKDVSDFYRKSSFLIMASASEGLPFVLVEAMACGVVPIVNDVGNISLLVSDSKNGILLESNATAKEYAERIAALLADKDEYARLQDNAVHSVQHLTYGAVTETWKHILDRYQV